MPRTVKTATQSNPLYSFKRLQLEIIKHRCRYYMFDDPSIPDYMYDMMERKYIRQAKQLKQENKIKVGFPLGRPKTFLYKLALMHIMLERVQGR